MRKKVPPRNGTDLTSPPPLVLYSSLDRRDNRRRRRRREIRPVLRVTASESRSDVSSSRGMTRSLEHFDGR